MLFQDDGRNICCCENCGRWQHTDCHDRHDDLYGKPRRNWDKDDFYCTDCKKRLARGKPGRKPKNPDETSLAKAVVKKSPNKDDGSLAAKPKKRKIEKPSLPQVGAAPNTPKIKFTMRNDRPEGFQPSASSHLSPPGMQPPLAHRSHSERSNGSPGGALPNGQYLYGLSPQQQYHPNYPRQPPIAGPSQPHQSFQPQYGQQPPLTQRPLDHRRMSGAQPIPMGHVMPHDFREPGQYAGSHGQAQQPRLPPTQHNLPARPNVPFPPQQQSQPSPVSRSMQVPPNGRILLPGGQPGGQQLSQSHDQRRMSHGSFSPLPPSHFSQPMPYAQPPPPQQNGTHAPMSAVPAGYVQSYSFVEHPSAPHAPSPHHRSPGQGGTFPPGPGYMPHSGQQFPAHQSMSSPVNGYMRPQ